MIKKSGFFYLLFIFFIFIVTHTNADLLPKAVLLPSNSTAVSDDTMSVVFNPAGLGVERGMSGYYFHTLSGKTGGDNAFFLSSLGFGFGAEFVDQGKLNFNKYTLSDGNKLFGGLYLGSNYSWFGSKDKNYDDLSSWDIGLLYRASNFLSFGFVARNLNRPVFNKTKTDRVYDIAFAFRPNTNRITFSVDSSIPESQKIKDSVISYAIEIEPIDGVLLRGCYKNDKSFDVRIGIGFPKFEFGSYSYYDKERKRNGGGIYTRLSSEQRRSLFQIGRNVLEITPEQINLLKNAKKDKTIEGAILKVGLGSYGFGTIQEMRDEIMDFRSSGKKIVCYMEIAGNKEYYLASACDRILLNPAGTLMFYGLRSEVESYKGTLDKLGIKADLYHIGKYKSMSEAYTDEGMSDAHRESLNSILDDLNEQMISGIADGRKVSKKQVQDWIDNGPYTSTEAISSMLVDKLAYADQVEELSSQVIGKKINKLSGKEYGNHRDYSYDWGSKSRIAIIYASGLMLPGRSIGAVPLIPISEIMGSETISEAIKEAREGRSVKAIVLRIDSGGGSIFASDVIWREIMLTKGKKPFIVSMGDIAASGGYYISCPADVIFAEPGTITGSIGVITGKLDLRGFYDKLGIKKEIIKRGKNSDIYSEYGSFTDEQREIIVRQMKEMYRDFVRKVAEGRNMSEDSVETIAQGRAWTGKQAKDNGLVDEFGGLESAVKMAKEKAKIGKDEEVDILALPRRVPLWRQLMVGNAVFLSQIKSALDVVSVYDRFSQENLFFIMPYSMDF